MQHLAYAMRIDTTNANLPEYHLARIKLCQVNSELRSSQNSTTPSFHSPECPYIPCEIRLVKYLYNLVTTCKNKV
jgi:hypothetical protein